MNAKLIFCIAMGVFVAHLAVIMLVFSIQQRMQPPPPAPRPPNFKVAEGEFVDASTGTRITVQEFTVTTRLAPAGTYTGRPDQPVVD
jgi:hypothetical protein